MEIKKQIVNIVETAFTITGFTMIVIALLTFFAGENAKEVSAIFALGNQGIPLAIVAEYFGFSCLISLLRFLFFTDILFKKWTITPRIVMMILIQIVLVGIFAYRFKWFPVDDPICWAAFFICFFICFVISVVITKWKEDKDNTKLEEGLKALREQAAKKQERETLQ